jgi:hypothetical protein
MIACTFLASHREAWQTRSGLGRTDAKRTDAGGLGAIPNKRTEPFPRKRERAIEYVPWHIHRLPNLTGHLIFH